MSRFTICPACKEHGDQKELGFVTHEGKQRHLFRCMRPRCGAVWEQVISKRPVKKGDPVLKVLV